MSRPLKFRVWDGTKYLRNYEPFLVNVHIWDYDHSPNPDWQRGLKGLVFEQFTGLTDWNDKEIYEGDILSVHYPERRRYENGYVFWSPEYLTYLIKHWYGDNEYASEYLCHRHNEGKEIQVIGNIHENPNITLS